MKKGSRKFIKLKKRRRTEKTTRQIKGKKQAYQFLTEGRAGKGEKKD